MAGEAKTRQPIRVFRPAKCAGVVVHLRAPRQGERGWWVQNHTDAIEALREVLRESEELGWDALHDYVWQADGNDMWPVTVEVMR